MKIRRCSPFACLFILLAALVAQARQTTYLVEGTVYATGNTPVAGVLIRLEDQSRIPIREEYTNSDGRYRLASVPAGTYYLTARPDEKQYQVSMQRIELSSLTRGGGGRGAEVERIDIMLKPTQRKGTEAPGVVFAQSVPSAAEKEYQGAMKSLKDGDAARATAHLQKALQLFPTYFLALQQLGLIYVKDEQYTEALEPLQKAIEVNPKAAASHLGLGMAYINLKRTDDALNELTLAHNLDAKDYRIPLALGMAQLELGHSDEAETAFKQALDLGGSVKASTARLYLASIYNSRQQYKEAIAELEGYLHDNPRADNAEHIQGTIKKLKAKLSEPL